MHNSTVIELTGNKPYEFKDLALPKYNLGDYVKTRFTPCGRIDGINGCTYLNPNPAARYVVKHNPFYYPKTLDYLDIPSHICLTEEEIYHTMTFKEACEHLTESIIELRKYKDAIMWLYSQKGHDLCHENIKDLFKRCGLPPKELELPPREEFRKRCMDYEAEIYIENLEKACGQAVESIDNMTESKDGY